MLLLVSIGFRIVEVNGIHVIGSSESQLYKLLNSSKSDAKIVVLRHDKNQHTMSYVDVDGLKDDLALALVELETLQQENQDLNNELNK